MLLFWHVQDFEHLISLRKYWKIMKIMENYDLLHVTLWFIVTAIAKLPGVVYVLRISPHCFLSLSLSLSSFPSSFKHTDTHTESVLCYLSKISEQNSRGSDCIIAMYILYCIIIIISV